MGDRVGREEFNLAHEYLATMLGVHLSEVTIVASTLEKAGTILYTGGRMKIVDRPKLQEWACGCYPILHTLTNRVFEVPAKQAS